MERRTFLGIASGLGIAVSLPSCASVAALAVTPEDGAIRLSVAAHPGLNARGGQLRLRMAGTGESMYVLALEGGEYVALSPICTHLGCTVDVSGERLVCPCHGSTYDRAGRVLRGPAEQPLRRYPTSLSPDGELIIRVDGGT